MHDSIATSDRPACRHLMNPRFPGVLASLITLVAGLVLLTGCPSGEGEPADSLVVGISDFPRQMDPRIGADLASSRFHQLVYAGLVARDAQLRPVPDLAESWERPDDRTFIFHLRKGLRFHDGSPLTAEDAAWTLRSTRDPALGSPRAADLNRIDSIEVRDTHTLVVRLNEPFAPFLQALVYLGIVPRNSNPVETGTHVGAGPFQFVSERQGEQVVLEAYDGYHGGAPGVRRITLKVIGEATVRAMELRKGDVHMIVMDIPPDLADMFRKRKGFRTVSKPGISYSYLALNMEDELLQHRAVRRALAHAVNREELTEHLLLGFAQPATSLLPPWHWAYANEAPDYPYDPDRARKLLDEAGYPDPDGEGGEPRFRLVYKTSTNQLARQQAAVIQQAWSRIGIETEIRSNEWGTFFEDLKSGSFQVAAARWVGIVDPDVYRLRFASRYFPPEGLNRGRYSNPEVDRLIDEGLLRYEESERKETYARIQDIIQSDVPYVSLYYPETIAVLREEVQGFELYPAGDFLPLRHVSLGQPLD